MSIIIYRMSETVEDFARAFGDALKAYLDDMGISYVDAATRLGVTKQALSTYWNDDVKGKRKKPRAELLFRACVDLNFTFQYRGYRVTAETLAKPIKKGSAASEQLRLDFSRQFNLTEDKGHVSVSLRRHPDSVQVSFLLKAAS
jgi:transcriptional regulator with XRE-family HTH domain